MQPARLVARLMAVTMGSAVFVAITVSLTAYGQTAAPAPAFAAASVRLHGPGNEGEQGNGPWLQISPGGVTMRNAAFVWCLAWAYDLKDWLISGPEWIRTERYDMVAKASGAVPVADLKVMMRTLLADRFRLSLHREPKELLVAALGVAKNGPRNLVASASTGPPEGPRPVGGKGGGSLIYRNVSMSDFADRLGGPIPSGVGERVVDATGLTGTFDITLKLDSGSFSGGREEFADFFKAAIEQQLGLKIERRKVRLETLVIDQGSKAPIEN